MTTIKSRLTSATDKSRLCASNDANIGIVQAYPPIPLRDQRATTMALAWGAKSEEARAFIADLYERLCDNSYYRRKTRLISAFDAIVYDLLTAASIAADTPCFRPMGLKTFTGHRVAYRAAKTAIDLMESNGLIRIAGGNIDVKSGGPGTVTRIFATPQLLQALADRGIEPCNRKLHFVKVDTAPKQVAKPILLNTGSRWQEGKRVKGKPLPVDYTNPVVAELGEQVNRINAFAASQNIEGADFMGFHRIFNRGDRPGVNFDKGGRLWAIGGGYQIMPSRLKPNVKPEDLRSTVRINGEKTVEVDIGSSHLTIFLTKQGIEFDPQSDLYEVAGYDRAIIKAYINLTLSLPRIPMKWPKSMMDDFSENKGYSLVRDHTIEEVSAACLDLYPILKKRTSIRMDWSDLQFIESQIVIDTVDQLNQTHDVTALPVHDSIIVQSRHRSTAIEILQNKFKDYVGVIPRVK